VEEGGRGEEGGGRDGKVTTVRKKG